MWTCLPLYWGAVADPEDLTSNLSAWFINRDGSQLGNDLWNEINNENGTGPRLKWSLIDAQVAGTDEDVANAVVDTKAWVALVVESGATQSLALARETGNSTYDPTSAITVYYAQARHEVATGSYLMPAVTTLLQTTTTAWATSSAQQYLALTYGGGQVNATALQLLAQAPQTISPGVSWTVNNLRPFNAPLATAVITVGQIYLSVFTFITAMAHAAARVPIQRHLRFSSILAIRLIVPLVAYIPMSITYTLVSLAFHLPFGAKYNPTAGFFLFAVFVYLDMAAIGLALEAMITLLTPKFIPFFMMFMVVANIACVSLPDDLQNVLYRYGTGFPMYNVSLAMRTIVFNTYSLLARNAGILLGWALLSCCTLVLFTWQGRRSEMNAAKRESAERRVSNLQFDNLQEDKDGMQIDKKP
ncbi:hypothetical protein SERLADRAFT_362324 [Serpula lacrymans var. lacrymans S7.9]|nr:uncharacterized protein SERLADRAFT_362324 [Serpula lacrymans var. lacrymans S7.9]EGO22942.1 hypothetical protein SERLADRAFT_362324 [Serpula lacrymans var. lacrymans S7.9]